MADFIQNYWPWIFVAIIIAGFVFHTKEDEKVKKSKAGESGGGSSASTNSTPPPSQPME